MILHKMHYHKENEVNQASEYDQEMQQSETADKPMRHRTQTAK